MSILFLVMALLKREKDQINLVLTQETIGEEMENFNYDGRNKIISFFGPSTSQDRTDQSHSSTTKAEHTILGGWRNLYNSRPHSDKNA